MTKKIALFMLGLATFGGTLGFVSANNTTNTATPSGFGLNESYSAGITGIAGTGQNQQNKLIDVIKTAINWVLGILGLITFVLLLWGGFQMVTAAGDDTKFQAGQKILKQAAIGLGFIAASWLMVTMIFYLINVFTK